MKLTRTQRLILYALGRFYDSLNQPLNEKHLSLKTLIKYEQRKINLTNKGIKILQKIDKEAQQFIAIREFFSEPKKPKRRLQTTIN